MKSPNGQYEAVCIDFEEVRMGSPLFGEIELKGTIFQLKNGLYGLAMAFSKDSRFFAANELTTNHGQPCYTIVVLDLDNGREFAIDSGPGLIQRIEWDDQGRVEIVAWTYKKGEIQKLLPIT